MPLRHSILAASLAIPALAIGTAASAQTALADGQSRTGALTTDSDMMQENVYFLDRYTVSGTVGERIEIVMRSEDFDTYLELGRDTDDGAGFNVLASDDDSAGELDSRLVFTFPESGNYIVRARSFSSGVTGSYLIEANRLPPPPPPPPPSPLAVGQSVEGNITAQSPSYSPNDYGNMTRHYDLYSVSGNAGDSVTVTLRSSDFDAFVEVGGMTPLGFAVMQSDDDGAAGDDDALGLDSQLTVSFVESGTMVIRATTLGANATGGYTLSVE